jgi:hypothetical protein
MENLKIHHYPQGYLAREPLEGRQEAALSNVAKPSNWCALLVSDFHIA